MAKNIAPNAGKFNTEILSGNKSTGSKGKSKKRGTNVGKAGKKQVGGGVPK